MEHMHAHLLGECDHVCPDIQGELHACILLRACRMRSSLRCMSLDQLCMIALSEDRAHLRHVDNGPELRALLIAERPGYPVQLALHHRCEEVWEAMVGQLELVQLIRDAPGHQHALLLVRVYHLADQLVACVSIYP